jgi:hypothetical protein
MSYEVYLRKARALAQERHLSRSLSSFRGCTLKGAWIKYTGASGYPALGAFYKHVKYSGNLIGYLEGCFTSDIAYNWERLGIRDEEIEVLLRRVKRARRCTMVSRDLGHDLYGVLRDE